MNSSRHERALDLGLVTRIADPDDLDSDTRALAATLAQKLPLALAIGKRSAAPPLGRRPTQPPPRIMVDNLMTPDTDEGITAFLAKRPPNWATS